MTGLVREQVRRLAGVLADLKARVRAALAGELARAVAGAVEEVVRAVVAGRTGLPRPAPAPAYPRSSPGRWADEDDGWGRSRDPWDDRHPDDWSDYDRPAPPATPVRQDVTAPPAAPAVTTAVAAGVHVARWWLARRGTLPAAAGAGLVVGLLGLAGGPAVRTAVAALATAADLVAVTDALGDGAARLAYP